MNGGLFITLYDENTLGLYLNKGIYGFLMNTTVGRIHHFHVLGDYACARRGTHVFFFLKRKIVYGGVVRGNQGIGSFYLNGNHNAFRDTPLVWDESQRDCYNATENTGVFLINEGEPKCQPYFILFDSNEELTGKVISSDDLYFELGSFPYPLPSNTISGMSFCTITPGETGILLNLLHNSPDHLAPINNEHITLGENPQIFQASFGLANMHDGILSEAHLEASVLGNPSLLPEALRPTEGDVLCRQVPMCPFKPSQLDKADICFYSVANPLRQGTIPNTIIELKKDRAGKGQVIQVQKYLKWLDKVCPNEAPAVKAVLLAPDFTGNIEQHILPECRERIELCRFG